MISRKALESYHRKPEKHSNRKYRKIKQMAIKTKLETVHLVLQYKALKSVMDSKGYQSIKVMTDKQWTVSSCTKRKKYRESNGKHPTTLHGLWVKRNDKGKSEKATKEKKRLKLTVLD